MDADDGGELHGVVHEEEEKENEEADEQGSEREADTVEPPSTAGPKIEKVLTMKQKRKSFQSEFTKLATEPTGKNLEAVKTLFQKNDTGPLLKSSPPAYLRTLVSLLERFVPIAALSASASTSWLAVAADLEECEHFVFPLSLFTCLVNAVEPRKHPLAGGAGRRRKARKSVLDSPTLSPPEAEDAVQRPRSSALESLKEYFCLDGRVHGRSHRRTVMLATVYGLLNMWEGGVAAGRKLFSFCFAGQLETPDEDCAMLLDIIFQVAVQCDTDTFEPLQAANIIGNIFHVAPDACIAQIRSLLALILTELPYASETGSSTQPQSLPPYLSQMLRTLISRTASAPKFCVQRIVLSVAREMVDLARGSGKKEKPMLRAIAMSVLELLEPESALEFLSKALLEEEGKATLRVSALEMIVQSLEKSCEPPPAPVAQLLYTHANFDTAESMRLAATNACAEYMTGPRCICVLLSRCTDSSEKVRKQALKLVTDKYGIAEIAQQAAWSDVKMTLKRLLCFAARGSVDGDEEERSLSEEFQELVDALVLRSLYGNEGVKDISEFKESDIEAASLRLASIFGNTSYNYLLYDVVDKMLGSKYGG